MPSTTFGQVIPVTGPNAGFPGTVSRVGERIIVARQLLSTTTHNLNFGEPAVELSDATGGTWQSIVDFLAAAAGNIAVLSANAEGTGRYAGIAVREVQTQLTYPTGVPGVQQVGYYAPGVIGEVLERGSITVNITHGTPQAGFPVFVRIVANGSLTGTAVGDLEAVADTVATTGTATSGTAALTVASGTGIVVGQIVTGAGVPANTYVSAVAGTAVTLSQNVTAALSATAVTFANTLALPATVFRTGYLDANNVAEITIRGRNAA